MERNSRGVLVRHVEPFPPTAGTPGLAQGSYGQRGNLELVIPDPLDGFWVFWFNADLDERHAGAALGRWSGGLHVPTRSLLNRVSIAQVPFGPNFLEVATEGSDGRQRWYWTPTDGFVHDGPLPDGPSGNGPVAVNDSLITVAADRCVVSGASNYPTLDWVADGPTIAGVRSASIAALAGRVALAVVRSDGVGALFVGDAPVVRIEGDWRELVVAGAAVRRSEGWQLVGIDQGGIVQLITVTDTDATMVVERVERAELGRPEPAAAVAATTSSLGEGTVEIVVRQADRLLHLRVSGGTTQVSELTSDVWVALPRPATVHRRSP
ncbi:hypothetical protein M6D93_18325 [Jatrophihabitans telluris]|uniref:Uncharacterized protein n=1 Tax=Jatrophihabitans telluris TaxID=2038343 RepID=A0ABY4QYC4_9ACTN|nr:hypothetical protein [Jatrophihabitans telluris]UQX88222.1 hypothetical protein M6D93_18325 [Jatrophihabitans telluris]